MSADPGRLEPALRRSTHPSVYACLYLPFGAVNGYLSVAIAYQLAQAGVSAEFVGALIAAFFMPQTWKFAWAPVVDLTLAPKQWYLIGAVLSALGAVGMAVCSTPPVRLPALTAAAVLASLATTFLGMALEAMVAHATSHAQQGRAGGWLQAGNFAGSGIGGGAALWLARHVNHAWITGAVLGLCFLLCCLGLLWIPKMLRAATELGIGARTRAALRDLWSVARSPRGYLAVLVLFLPIGSAAAASLFSVIPSDWHASATAVELANGTLSGVTAMLGCLVGGYFSDKMNRKVAYIVYGLLLGSCALAMALAPHRQTDYIVFVLLYNVISGVCYAGFTAVTLEAIGSGVAATKYNLFACLANAPTAYMSALEGWARTHHGVNAFLYLDFVAPIFAALVFGAAVAARAGRRGERMMELSES